MSDLPDELRKEIDPVTVPGSPERIANWLAVVGAVLGAYGVFDSAIMLAIEGR